MSTPFPLIALIGMPGSGKSVAAEFFRKRNISVLRFGDQTDIGLKEHNLLRNEKNERWYREKLREDFGMAAMAIKIEPRIVELSKETNAIVLDGLYSWEEYVYLKHRFPQLKLLCMYAPPPLRYTRLQKREIRPLTEDEARSRDISEIENLHKGGPIAMADFLVVNDGTEKEFLTKLEVLAKRIL